MDPAKCYFSNKMFDGEFVDKNCHKGKTFSNMDDLFPCLFLFASFFQLSNISFKKKTQKLQIYNHINIWYQTFLCMRK